LAIDDGRERAGRFAQQAFDGRSPFVVRSDDRTFGEKAE